MATGDKVTMENMAYPQLSDLDMAHKVRSLMRDTLEHEGVVCGARDRIMYLSQQLEEIASILDYPGNWDTVKYPTLQSAVKNTAYLVRRGRL